MRRDIRDRIIDAALPHPYFHLPKYMRRWWLFGADSLARNEDNPNWTQEHFDACRRDTSWFYQWLTKWIGIRVHHILRSDDDRHLHDHPSWSISIILYGGYFEVMPVDRKRAWWNGDHEQAKMKWRGPGNVVLRRATSRHKLILPRGQTCWSIFVLGKKSNAWGFYTPSGKVYWRTYLGLEKK